LKSKNVEKVEGWIEKAINLKIRIFSLDVWEGFNHQWKEQ